MDHLRGRVEGQTAPCVGSTSTFFGPHEDLRMEYEKDRKEREARCKAACQECFMRLECLSFALRNQETFGVWGGMSTGDRREFLKRIKKHRQGNWKKALEDYDYLRYKAEVFLRQEEERLRKLNRQKEQKSGRGRSATVVVLSSRRRNGTGTGSVSGGNGSGSVGRGRSGGRAQVDQNRPERAAGKVASPSRTDQRRSVQG